MESGFVWGAFLGALAGSALAFAVAALVVRAWLDRRLARAGSAPAHAASDGPVRDDAFADVAPELITLARAATDSAIRTEELNDWHRPSMSSLGSDDVSEIIRGKLRRASFNAVASRAALSTAIRRHRASLPAALESDLLRFCEGLETDGNGASSSERKRKLAADLDRLEARVREALAAPDTPPAQALTESANGLA